MNPDKLISKILVLDNNPEHADAIKQFCDEHNLIGVTVRKNRLFSVLASDIGFGAILLAEEYCRTPEESGEMAIRIKTLRPELPIILRRTACSTLDGLPDSVRRTVTATYIGSDMAPLKKIVDEYIFCLEYPNALVRGIGEITETVLARQFRDLDIRADTPCIVRDHIIFGEVFSLIPLESAWCRGYMLMQTEEVPLLQLMSRQGQADAGFRDVNGLLGEITNLTWGAFKNRYIGDAAGLSASQVQIPIIVNHKHKYISFGSENPQLCFFYQLRDETSGLSIRIDQRFIFDLSWSPEDFREMSSEATAVVGDGELELF